jgi:pilus assembly protein FimV
MVDNNKILTVSYGTFSCTLEGFENSFSTMKAIAEYFRDLASDDRYFGAEPPTPDAAMLAQIAQREVSRHVDASVDGNDVVLRAAAPDAVQIDAPSEQDSPSQADVSLDDAPKTKDRKAAKAAKAKRKHAKAKAEKAKRKRARQAQKTANQQAGPENLAPLAGIEHSDAPALDAATSAADSDSVAAKLARIRSVVTPAGDTSDGDTFSEDQHAADTTIDIDASFEDLAIDDTSAPDDDTDMASVLAALSQSDEPVDPINSETADADFSVDTTEEGTDDNDASILNTLATLNLGAETRIDEPVDVSAPDTLQEVSKPLARVVKVKRKDFEAALAAGGLEEIDDTEVVEYDAVFGNDTIDIDSITESVAESVGETTLSDEDEAELMAELAAVEQDVKKSTLHSGEIEDAADADVSSMTLASETYEDVETGLDAEPQDAAQRLDPVGDADGSVDRLLTKTQDEFDQPETGRRRNAIAHLKAAVAATRAERSAQGELVQADETDTYRDDLAQVVRPRRAMASGKRSDRPVQKAPPLTLVAEQRIDLDTSEKETVTMPSAPVRPRRVAKMKSRISDDDLGSFQEFADAQGASDLPDLLEAAAAYASYIKGQPTFTRPELMSKVMTLSEEEPHSREDSLRSFGQLLREGKIVKIKKGQFTVAEDTRFRPETARFAGE